MGVTSVWHQVIKGVLFRDALKSRVGRQLFLRFMLVALLPIIGLAGYVYFTTSHMLVEEAQGRLQLSSKSLGYAIVDRLNQQAKVLTHLAEIYPIADFSPGGLLHDLTSISHSEIARLPDATQRQLARGGVVMRFGAGVPPSIHMLIQRPETHQILTAQLDPRQIWQNEMSPENFCVLTHDLQRLFCTPTLHSVAIGALLQPDQGRAQGVFEFTQESEQYLGSYWRLGLQGGLANSGIVVAVVENRVGVLGALDALKRFYLALAVLVLGIAAWVAVAQIRRQLRPLNELIAGARRLADGHFDDRLDTRDVSEFGQLADAFNRMAMALSDKFHVQKTFARLDRTILDASIIDDVIRLLLDDLASIARAEHVAVAHFGSQDKWRLFTPEGLREATLDETRALTTLAPRIEPGYWLPIDPHDDALLLCFDTCDLSHIQHVCVYGVYLKTRCVGVVMLGFSSPRGLSDEVAEATRGLVDRLSVAVAKLAAEEALRHQAYHDPLTNLPNRSLLRDHAEQAMERAARDGTVTGLLLADLDKFKEINDSLGHVVGDTLLQISAQRLRTLVRPGDTVARFGGDEFVILLPDLAPQDALVIASQVAHQLTEVLAVPMEIQGHHVTTLVSVGIALYPDNARDFDDLLKMADAAMYEAKRDPNQGFAWYSQHMNASLSERFALKQALYTAIDQDEMVLHYQPKVSLADQRISGAEALVRWQSPVRGLLPPGAFIPLLDEMGLGDQLGEWVLARTCAQMAEWDQQGLPSIPVSINLATSQLLDPALCTKIQQSLSRYDLSPTRLEIEILESTVVSDSPVVRGNMNTLIDMGINVALDDFGTGYSSLSYLTDVAATVLKLDRSFILKLASDSRQQAIVTRIIALAKVLGLTVVAEGIEEADQLAILKDMGCDLYQGYLYSRPLPSDEFAQLLGRESANR